jgi:hypothetical protein
MKQKRLPFEPCKLQAQPVPEIAICTTPSHVAHSQMTGKEIIARIGPVVAGMPLLYFAVYGPVRACLLHEDLPTAFVSAIGPLPPKSIWYKSGSTMCAPMDALGISCPSLKQLCGGYTGFCYRVMYGKEAPFLFY